MGGFTHQLLVWHVHMQKGHVNKLYQRKLPLKSSLKTFNYCQTCLQKFSYWWKVLRETWLLFQWAMRWLIQKDEPRPVEAEPPLSGYWSSLPNAVWVGRAFLNLHSYEHRAGSWISEWEQLFCLSASQVQVWAVSRAVHGRTNRKCSWGAVTRPFWDK